MRDPINLGSTDEEFVGCVDFLGDVIVGLRLRGTIVNWMDGKKGSRDMGRGGNTLKDSRLDLKPRWDSRSDSRLCLSSPCNPRFISPSDSCLGGKRFGGNGEEESRLRRSLVERLGSKILMGHIVVLAIWVLKYRVEGLTQEGEVEAFLFMLIGVRAVLESE